MHLAWLGDVLAVNSRGGCTRNWSDLFLANPPVNHLRDYQPVAPCCSWRFEAQDETRSPRSQCLGPCPPSGDDIGAPIRTRRTVTRACASRSTRSESVVASEPNRAAPSRWIPARLAQATSARYSNSCKGHRLTPLSHAPHSNRQGCCRHVLLRVQTWHILESRVDSRQTNNYYSVTTLIIHCRVPLCKRGF